MVLAEAGPHLALQTMNTYSCFVGARHQMEFYSDESERAGGRLTNKLCGLALLFYFMTALQIAYRDNGTCIGAIFITF